MVKRAAINDWSTSIPKGIIPWSSVNAVIMTSVSWKSETTPPTPNCQFLNRIAMYMKMMIKPKNTANNACRISS